MEMASATTLAAECSTAALYAKAREQGIVITPGSLFSSQDRYRNFLRLSFAHPFTEQRVDALALLGQLIAPIRLIFIL
jgi:DNA-binding transcriptional MocR family regulator